MSGRNYYRIMLGRQSTYAEEAYKGRFIGAHYSLDVDFTSKLPENWRDFNEKYIPVYLQPYYKKKGWKMGDFPKAEQFYKRCLSLPIFPSMSEAELDYIIHEIQEFLNR